MDNFAKDEFDPAVLLQQKSGGYELMLIGMSEAGYAIVDERGLQGGGYTWEGLCRYLVRSRAPELVSEITYDCEGDTFIAQAQSLEVIRKVGALVQQAMNDPVLIREAFDKAEPDELE